MRITVCDRCGSNISEELYPAASYYARVSNIAPAFQLCEKCNEELKRNFLEYMDNMYKKMGGKENECKP